MAWKHVGGRTRASSLQTQVSAWPTSPDTTMTERTSSARGSSTVAVEEMTTDLIASLPASGGATRTVRNCRLAIIRKAANYLTPSVPRL